MFAAYCCCHTPRMNNAVRRGFVATGVRLCGAVQTGRALHCVVNRPGCYALPHGVYPCSTCCYCTTVPCPRKAHTDMIYQNITLAMSLHLAKGNRDGCLPAGQVSHLRGSRLHACMPSDLTGVCLFPHAHSQRCRRLHAASMPSLQQGIQVYIINHSLHSTFYVTRIGI